MQIYEKNIPEGFKTCFDTAKSKISKNAADPAKNYGFTKQKHIRGDKTLKIWNFGPNVVYFDSFCEAPAPQALPSVQN